MLFRSQPVRKARAARLAPLKGLYQRLFRLAVKRSTAAPVQPRTRLARSLHVAGTPRAAVPAAVPRRALAINALVTRAVLATRLPPSPTLRPLARPALCICSCVITPRAATQIAIV